MYALKYGLQGSSLLLSYVGSPSIYPPMDHIIIYREKSKTAASNFITGDNNMRHHLGLDTGS